MKKAAFLAGASIVALAFVFPAEGRPRGISPTASPPASGCSHSAAGYADGCSGANPNALFINTAAFNAPNTPGSLFQSASQSAVLVRPPWDVAGGDYPVGQITPDTGLIDATVTPPTGCTYGPSDQALLYVRCPGTGNTVDISGYKFIGVGLWMTGTGQTLKGTDWHLQMTVDSCRRYNGIGPIRGGSSTIQIKNYTGDWDGQCANNADQYKEAGDPGFADLSSGSATLVGFALTYQSTPTGNVQVGSYIQVAGQPHMRSRITSGSGLNWIVETPDDGTFPCATISGTTLTYDNVTPGCGALQGSPQVGDAITGGGLAANTLLVANLGSKQWQISISQTITTPFSALVWKQWNYPTPVTVTTGPVESNSAALIAGHGGPIDAKYGYLPHWGTAFGNTGGGPIDIRFNYWTSPGRNAHPHTTDGQHNQFMAWIPQPGVTTLNQQSLQDFNTIQAEPWGDDGTYTGVVSQFSTCSSCSPVANARTGYMIQFGLVSMSNNVLVGNETLNAPAKLNISGMFRTLSQLGGGAVASVNWSLNSGVATINSRISGSEQVGDTILCSSFPNCTQAVVLTSQIDATHYNTINTTDTKTSIVNSVAAYPGWFINLNIKDNFVASTSSSGTVFEDLSSIRVDNRDTSGNTDMLTGGTAN